VAHNITIIASTDTMQHFRWTPAPAAKPPMAARSAHRNRDAHLILRRDLHTWRPMARRYVDLAANPRANLAANPRANLAANS